MTLPRLLLIAPLLTTLGCTIDDRSSSHATPPVDIVSGLYHDFAWEVVMSRSDSRHGLLEQPAVVLSTFFDDSLTQLLVRDHQCTLRTREQCKLDGSPIWASNDPRAFDLSVTPTTDSSVVQVSFRRNIPGDVELTTLSYRLTMTPRGWRIRDIVSPDGWSLLELLR